MSKHVTIYINGQYHRVPSKVLEAFTPGIFQGKGVFETLLAIGDKVFDVHAHLQRLNRSFKGAKVSASIIQRVVQVNGFDLARVRVLAWREKKQVHVVVMVLKYAYPKDKVATACFIKTDRVASSKFAHKKSLDYGMFAQAYNRAQAKGFDEALLINRSGHVFEASRANVFIVRDGKLVTAPLSSGCLNGITRQHVILQAKRAGLPVVEKNLTPAMVRSADEVFLTNSLSGIRVVKISSIVLPR